MTLVSAPRRSVPASLGPADVVAKLTRLIRPVTSLVDVIKICPECTLRGVVPDNAKGAAEWTNALLNSLLDIGREYGFSVHPEVLSYHRGGHAPTGQRGNSKRDEFIVDACWTVDWGEANPELLGAQKVLLACECEWGAHSPRRPIRGEERIQLVLKDFAKLVHVRADVKVMIFGYPTAEGVTFDSVAGRMSRMAAPDPGSSYLLLGWDTAADWSHRHELNWCFKNVRGRWSRTHVGYPLE